MGVRVFTDISVAKAENVFRLLAKAFIIDHPQAALLYFSGEMGAGKSTCIRSLLRTLGVTGAIKSPTYSLLEQYEITGWLSENDPTNTKLYTVTHWDLYRLEHPEEIENVGWRDYLSSDQLLLIEWPEKGKDVIRANPDIWIKIEIPDDLSARTLYLEACTPFGAAWMQSAAVFWDNP